MKLPIEEQVEVPGGITASLDDGVLTVKGKGEVSRSLKHPKIDVSIKDNKIVLFCGRGTKREKNIMFTFVAHIDNDLRGVQLPYVYKLKVCSGHFPMNVAVSGDYLEVRNFLGEKSPRRLKIKKGVNVKVSGDVIVIDSPDLELAGNVASDIERLMFKGTRDLRRFQDGIYLIERPK